MSSTTVSITPRNELDPFKKKRLYFGLLFDDYTPQVEAQILRDCLAIQSMSYGKYDELVMVCDNPRVDAVLGGLGLRSVPTKSLTKRWFIYKTKRDWPQEPEGSTLVIQRDLYQPVKEQILTVLDDQHTNGYYLPPQGRLKPDTISLLRPAPNGYVPLDPSLILLWT